MFFFPFTISGARKKAQKESSEETNIKLSAVQSTIVRGSFAKAQAKMILNSSLTTFMPPKA
jgi:hypothetical protein